MIDAHCHIHDEQFDDDREEVIRRAFEGGVKKMLAIGTDIAESRKAIMTAERYENILAGVGIHPEEFTECGSQNADRWMKELEKLLKHPKVVGIGEVGLDYYSHTGKRMTDKGKEYQKNGFLAQAVLARKYDLPLIIHTRPSSRESDDAYEDLLYLLGQMSNVNGQMFVLHSYQGSISMTEKFLALPSVYFSFAGYITYPVKKVLAGGVFDIRESIKIIPIDRILTETDSPYLAPQAIRGTRNEPAYVKYVVEELSRLQVTGYRLQAGEEGKQQTENEEWKTVERETEKNFEKLFISRK